MKIIFIIMCLFFMICANLESVEEEGLVPKWTPTTNEVNMALVLAEYKCKYFLADHLKGTNFVGQVSKQPINPIPKKFDDDIPEKVDSWTVMNNPYTNYVRKCHAFYIDPGGDQVRIIAVQHFLKSCQKKNVKTSDAKSNFTLYFNLRTGSIDKTLNMPFKYFSPHPPYFLNEIKYSTSESDLCGKKLKENDKEILVIDNEL